MSAKDDMLIITAASAAYADSLLGLLGSLNCNWPGHPPVMVYDLGLEARTLDFLAAGNIPVRKVPAFCPHWRQHFTWKIWACQDAPAPSYLWLDAGICVLRPLPEVVATICALGYFAVPNGLMLFGHMTPGLQKNLALTDELLREMPSLSGGIHGFSRSGVGQLLLDEALALARVEENLRATAPRQFHEQTLLTVLLHKYFAPVTWADRIIYGVDQGGMVSLGQRLWCHRRSIQPADVDYYRNCLIQPQPPHLPTPPPAPSRPSLFMRARIRIAKMRGRSPTRDPGTYTYDGVRD